MKTAKEEVRTTQTIEEQIAGMSRPVAPMANGEMIDYSIVVWALVKYVRSDRMPAGQGPNGRPWLKHVFQLPPNVGGDYFALGGCMELDQRIRSIKAGDVVILEYRGKMVLGGGREQHGWNVHLVTAGQDERRRFADACRPVYDAIHAATERRRAERAAGRRVDAPTHTDADAPEWASW